jgi:uncharacterized membrane protein
MSRARARELLFRVSVWLKGLHAALEIFGGVALFIISPGFILRAVASLTQDELAEDSRDFIATHLLHYAQSLSVGSQRFMAIYLLAHGVIKIVLVAALLKEKLSAYPVAMLVFAGFIAYQAYRFTFTHALGLIALSLFDCAVIWLVWLEYRALEAAHRRP